MRRLFEIAAIWCVVFAGWLLVPMSGSLAFPISSSIASVPEPGSLALLVSGVAATLYVIHRRRK